MNPCDLCRYYQKLLRKNQITMQNIFGTFKLIALENTNGDDYEPCLNSDGTHKQKNGKDLYVLKHDSKNKLLLKDNELHTKFKLTICPSLLAGHNYRATAQIIPYVSGSFIAYSLVVNAIEEVK